MIYIITPEQDRRDEGCPICTEIVNKKEGDVFLVCEYCATSNVMTDGKADK